MGFICLINIFEQLLWARLCLKCMQLEMTKRNKVPNFMYILVFHHNLDRSQDQEGDLDKVRLLYMLGLLALSHLVEHAEVRVAVFRWQVLKKVSATGSHERNLIRRHS